MHTYYFNLRNQALTGKILVLLKCMSLILQHNTNAGSINV